MIRQGLKWLLICLAIPVLSQAPYEFLPKKSTFHILGVGGHLSQIRNVKLSPIFYEGGGSCIAISRISGSWTREVIWSIDGYKGQYEFGIGAKSTTIKKHRLSSSFTQLFVLPKLSKGKWNVKVGYQLLASIQEQKIPSWDLAHTFSMLNSAFGTLKVSWDRSQKHSRAIRCLGLSFRRKARSKTRSIRISWGLISNTLQYSNDLVHSNLWIKKQALGKYKYRTFQGRHLLIEINKTTFLENGNAFRWSTRTEIYQLGDGSRSIANVQHSISFLLLFGNTVKKKS